MSSGTSELHAVGVGAPADAKASMTLRALVIASRVAGRRDFRRRALANRRARPLRLGEAVAPLVPVDIDVPNNEEKLL